ncbi:MAG: tyrosyl-tRNA synthetase [Myxococcaceae bacterium]|nr:tyrosyl-tRNA synthetase [Myxococcaceae bacterium]
MNFIAELRARGLFQAVSDEAGLAEALGAGAVTGYIGFDPTAASLHVGSLFQVLLLLRLQRSGHRPIAIVGGGTGLIGDPSGKSDERSMLSPERLAENVAGLRAQLSKYVEFGDGPTGALLVDNAEWLGSIGLLEFLRDVGKHFSVNAMVQRDSVRNRLEQREHGISYTEFSYMLLQAYDFLALHDRFGCTLQLGGSDQWGNIVSGVDLVRRLRGREVFGLTTPLLTRSDGKKFGKSEAGNVWLDPALTSPYEFYQFWLNTADDDVERYLLALTLEPVDAVAAVMAEHRADPAKRAGQRALAAAVTRFVHSDAALASARRTTELLFQGGDLRALAADELAAAFKSAPNHAVDRAALGTPDAGFVKVLADAGLFKSRSEARTFVGQGGASINGVAVSDVQRVLGADDLLPGGFIALRKGRKSWHVVRVTGA